MTKNDDFGSASLVTVAASLEARVMGIDDRVGIATTTDLDESFVVGTSQAFIRLAAALLRAAANDGAIQEVEGVKCCWSTHTYDVRDNLATVAVGAECVVRSDEDRRRLIEYFRKLVGDA